MKHIIFISLLASAALITACRTTKKIQTAISKTDTTAVQIHPVVILPEGEDTAATITENYAMIVAKNLYYTAFSAKIEVDYIDADGKKYNVNAHVRMQKDSTIWISVTAILGIEGLRALITKDSIKILDKQNKTYTARSIDYLEELTALPLTLQSLQDLFIGNPVFFNKNIIGYSRSQENISFKTTGEFIKGLFTFNDQSKQLQSTKLDDANERQNRSCLMTYDKYDNKKGKLFAEKREIRITEKSTMTFRLDYKQYEFNETLSFPFSIPKTYKAI
ncbi:MAG: hypothetical protein RIR12_2177 [Bacteroidota bacterium]|jgi:hypothetical protein